MMFFARPVSVFLCLLPFRVPRKAKIFLSWVGLRGAVPIIFATYPIIAGIEDADFLFNVVFVITLLSLSLQGTTISSVARRLDLALPEPKEGNEFGVELPEELNSQLTEIIIKPSDLSEGSRLADMHFEEGTLVMMVKRGNSIIVPNGRLVLCEGDILLTITHQETPEPTR